MNLNEFLNQFGVTDDQKMLQFSEMAAAYSELAEMDVWEFMENALMKVECPSCIGRQVDTANCRYCAGTGKVEWHLLTHPMNLRH